MVKNKEETFLKDFQTQEVDKPEVWRKLSPQFWGRGFLFDSGTTNKNRHECPRGGHRDGAGQSVR